MRSLRKTFLAVFLGRGLMAVRQLCLVPVLLKTWGVDYYGSWLVLSSIPSFLAMSNLGLGTSASARIAIRSGDDLDSENRLTLWTAWSFIISIYLILVAIIGGLNVARQETFNIIPFGVLVIVFLVSSLFVRMCAQPIHGWWASRGMASKSIQYNNVYSIGDLVIYMMVPFLGGKAYHLTACSLIWSSVWLISYVYYSYSAGCPLFRPRRPRVAEAKVLLSKGLGHQLSPLWQGMLFQGSIILANTLLGPAGAALWGSLRVINRAGNQLLELVSQTVGPEFQRNKSSGDLEANKLLHARSILISLILSAGVCVTLMIAGPFVFGLWTHHQFTVPTAVWFIVPLALLPFSLWWVSGEYQRAVNQPWKLNVVGTIASLCSLLVTYALGGLGIIGMCLGALVFEIVMAATIFPMTLTLLEDSKKSFVEKVGSDIKLFQTWLRGKLSSPGRKSQTP